MKNKIRISSLWAAGLAVILQMGAATTSQAQCLSEGFEWLTNFRNGIYLFRRPNFSGSTQPFLDPSIDWTLVSNEQAHTGWSSLKVEWKFLDSAPSPRWLRLTTFPTAYAKWPNPALGRNITISFWIYVPESTPDFYVTAGIREIAKVVPCGLNGGTTGPIEWVGASERRVFATRAPLGKLVREKNQWVRLSFSLPCEPVLSFTGNGLLDAPNLVFESLAFTPADDSNVGPFVIYMDDFEFNDLPTPTIFCPADQKVVGGCDGTAFWNPAQVDCPAAVVESSHNPGDALGFGVTTITTTATDRLGRSSTCSYKVEVLPPVPLVEFLPPLSGTEANRFQAGQTIPVRVQVFDCAGQLVTGGVTLTINVTGVESDGLTVFHDVDEAANGVGNDVDEVLQRVGKVFMFNLDTTDLLPGTEANDRFYRLAIGVWDNATGLLLGAGEVTLESQ